MSQKPAAGGRPFAPLLRRKKAAGREHSKRECSRLAVFWFVIGGLWRYPAAPCSAASACHRASQASGCCTVLLPTKTRRQR